MCEDPSDLLLWSFFNTRLFLRADLQESAFGLHLYLPASRAVGGGKRLTLATPGQVGLRPVTTAIVSRALISPTCLSNYRASGGSRVEGCLFVRLLGRGHPGRSAESTDGGQLRGEVMEEEALIAGLSSLG